MDSRFVSLTENPYIIRPAYCSEFKKYFQNRIMDMLKQMNFKGKIHVLSNFDLLVTCNFATLEAIIKKSPNKLEYILVTSFDETYKH